VVGKDLRLQKYLADQRAKEYDFDDLDRLYKRFRARQESEASLIASSQRAFSFAWALFRSTFCRRD
jgi:hypothetical protein